MIINKDFYWCPTCEEMYSFDTSQPYSKECPVCKHKMNFKSNGDCDTELAEKRRKEQEAYEQTEEYKEWYRKNGNKPKVECPYCHSTDTSKLGYGIGNSKFVRAGWYSSVKVGEWHCNNCNSDF